MLKRVTKRLRRALPSPAMTVALLALFIAMGGSAVAANHYLISSSKQISPKLLKKLKGRTGPIGPKGLTGVQGPQGSPGVQGQAGQNLTAATPLPSGKSESGAFSAGGGADNGFEYAAGKFSYGYIGAGITYVQPLATPIPNKNIIDIKSSSQVTTECPEVGKAALGYLCLYNYVSSDVQAGYGYSSDTGYFSSPSPGVVLYWEVEQAGEPYAGGEYTVTAP